MQNLVGNRFRRQGGSTPLQNGRGQRLYQIVRSHFAILDTTFGTLLGAQGVAKSSVLAPEESKVGKMRSGNGYSKRLDKLAGF